jgi:NhaA family Na+:H+ antiporter
MSAHADHSIPSALELSTVRSPIDPLVNPIRRFAGLSISGGIVLLACAAIAMLWANLWPESYEHLLHTHMIFAAGSFKIDQSILHWIDDVLMAIFFLLVGLEIKRELIAGELSSLRKAALPVVAALGGMVMPALLYVLVVVAGGLVSGDGVNLSSPGMRGWGIPMATDIAFAIGVLALLGRRVPIGLRVFLAALAIADDMGALVVIAVFYTESLNMNAMAWAGGVYGLLVLCSLLRVRDPIIYILFGVILLYFMTQTGIHSTIAGVLVASVIPMSSKADQLSFLRSTKEAIGAFEREGDGGRRLSHNQIAAAQLIGENATHVRSPLHRIEHGLMPWVTFLILPIFALTNAGVNIGGLAINSETVPVGLGICLGLVVGKPVGIVLASWLSVKMGIASLPTGCGWDRMWGVGCIAGIGFTMAVFITGLAFTNHQEISDFAKLAVLIASCISSVLGIVLLARCCTRHLNDHPADAAHHA